MDDLPPIGAGESFAVQFKEGEKQTLLFKGLPTRLRLRIVTPGGSIIEAPLAPHAGVEITGGTDCGDLQISVTIEPPEGGEAGLHRVE